ncbi:LysE family transporter [Winogradskyella sediminis]|uniref:Threonine/homoserine/homoserine lactone efflux protein n=1 Tax=Winogradskyella sediminis TaxID=1382466 RepID=A0A1H1WSN8_9FLAO|nr:LysE family transporter [Winogradskyella sediminis]SDT00084.1 Threonine/homoserine/homoserine lactone efflux protein [Winogradskyella sediminis]
MNFFVCLGLGFIVATSGSIVPSYLNLTVVKYSLKSGKIAAFFLIGGFATVLFFQANIGAYFSDVLMKNSEYITFIQKIGSVILMLLSINFFRLHFNSKGGKKKIEIKKSKAYLSGIGLSLLNTIAIPFYFTSISLLISLNYFEYSLQNSLYFSIGSTLGSFTLYALHAIVANKIEHKLNAIADKMNLILGCLTAMVSIINLISIYVR